MRKSSAQLLPPEPFLFGTQEGSITLSVQWQVTKTRVIALHWKRHGFFFLKAIGFSHLRCWEQQPCTAAGEPDFLQRRERFTSSCKNFNTPGLSCQWWWWRMRQGATATPEPHKIRYRYSCCPINRKIIPVGSFTQFPHRPSHVSHPTGHEGWKPS